MISFLSSAKSFLGKCREIQIRAIQSWLAAAPGAEVILYGRSDGAPEVCEGLGVCYTPGIETSQSGVPYFNSIVQHARDHAKHDIQVYLNCDVLLNGSLAEAVRAVDFRRFLMVGQRIDLADGVMVDIQSPRWLDDLRSLMDAGTVLSLHPPSGKDYFVFTRGLWDGMANVVIGRAGYDDALMAHCLRHDIPIIDTTFAVVALHQYHPNGHLNCSLQEVLNDPDVVLNVRNHKGIVRSAPLVSDAEWTLRGGQLERTRMRGDRLRQLELYFRFTKGWEIHGYAVRFLWRIADAAGFHLSSQINLGMVLENYSGLSKQMAGCAYELAKEECHGQYGHRQCG